MKINFPFSVFCCVFFDRVYNILPTLNCNKLHILVECIKNSTKYYRSPPTQLLSFFSLLLLFFENEKISDGITDIYISTPLTQTIRLSHRSKTTAYQFSTLKAMLKSLHVVCIILFLLSELYLGLLGLVVHCTDENIFLNRYDRCC